MTIAVGERSAKRGATKARRSVSIATVLAMSFGTLVALGVAAVLAIGFGSNQKNTFSLLDQQAALMVELIRTGVENHLSPAAEKGRHVEMLVADDLVDMTDDAVVENTLLASLAGTPQIAAAGYFDTARRGTFAIRDPIGGLEVQRVARDDTEEVRKLLRQARASDEAFWGRIFFEPESRVTFLNRIQPLRKDNEFIGFVVFVISIPELSEFITGVGSEFGGTGFILVGQDRVLAHPNLTSPHPDLSREKPLVALDRVGDLVLASWHLREREGGFDPAAARSVAVHSIDLGNDDIYIAFSGTMTDFGPVPWTVGAYVDSELVDTELERLLYSGLAGFGVLLISILAAVVLGRVIAKPIKAMAVEATQIGALEFGSVEPLRPSHIRELRDQAEAFNRMLAGLRWFETYVPRALVKRLMDRSDEGAFASEERTVTIMFTDIVGFSSLSEKMPAGQVAELLNGHFELLGRCVEAQGGTIDKFIGDALMAFWGAPDDQPDHAARACRAAAAASEAMAAANRAAEKAGRPRIRVRIGLHTGQAVVGNIGAPGRINYTIVGEAVNVAQRLEELGKQLDSGTDTTVLVSRETARSAGEEGLGQEEAIGFEPAGRFEVRGRREPIEVMRLLSTVETEGGAAPAPEDHST